MSTTTSAPATVIPSPRRLLGLVTGAILGADLLAEFFILMVPQTSEIAPWWAVSLYSLVEGVMVTAFMLPLLHLYLFRPLDAQLRERRRAEAALRQANRELTLANQALAHSNQELLTLSAAEHSQRQLAEALVKDAVALNSSLDLDSVLEHILEEVQRVAACDAATVLLLKRDWVEIARCSTFGTADILSSPIKGFPIDKAPWLSSLLVSRQPRRVSDAAAEPMWIPIPSFEWSRSLVVAPLVQGADGLGFICLFSEQPGAIHEGVLTWLVAFAAHATLAVHNASLFHAVQGARAHLQLLSRHFLALQEAERASVARELHDEASQALTSLHFRLEELERKANDPSAVAAEARELKQLTNEIMEGLHRLAIDLRPASLDHLGLADVLTHAVERLRDQHGLAAQIETSGLDGQRLPSEVETALYRIAQESLANIVRHAQARRVDVLLQVHADQVRLVVKDDGVGFDLKSVAVEEHLGLLGMQERCEMLGGRMVLQSAVGHGTSLVVEIPYANPHPRRG